MRLRQLKGNRSRAGGAEPASELRFRPRSSPGAGLLETTVQSGRAGPVGGSRRSAGKKVESISGETQGRSPPQVKERRR